MEKSQIQQGRDVCVLVCGVCMRPLLDVYVLHVLLQDFTSVGLGRPHTDKALFAQRPNCRERQTKALWGERIQVEKTTNVRSLRSERTRTNERLYFPFKIS